MRLAAALALVALALTGCETTAEKSAKLERAALRAAGHVKIAQGLSITRASTLVKVTQTTVVHGSEGTAVVVTLRNDSGRALREVPIAITVRGAGGSTLYTNSAPGLARTLVSAPLLPAHAELSWVDDQIPTAGSASGAGARVGQAPAVTGTIPKISISGTHLYEDPTNGTGAEGMAVNHSAIAQREIVIYAVARRGSRIVAAGRALLPLLAPAAPTRFQVFFVGDPKGARLSLSAPPTTLG